jgi:hypothetical protein
LTTPAPRCARHPLKGATPAARHSRFRGVLGGRHARRIHPFFHGSS